MLMTEKDTPEFSVSNVGGVSSVRSFKIWRMVNSSCRAQESRGNHKCSQEEFGTQTGLTRISRSFSVTETTGRLRCTDGSTMSNGMHF